MLVGSPPVGCAMPRSGGARGRSARPGYRWPDPIQWARIDSRDPQTNAFPDQQLLQMP